MTATPLEYMSFPDWMPENPLEGFWFGLSHGFNVKDGGEATTDRLRPFLEALGGNVTEFDRDWDGLIESSLERNKQADRIAKFTRRFEDDADPARRVLIGHSHGCSIIQRAFMRDPHLSFCCQRVMLINPALKVTARFPHHVNYSTYFSPNDKTVSLARWLDFLPWRWFNPHPWGDGGRRGIQGGKNVNLETLTGRRIEHSTVFKTPRLTGALVADITLALWCNQHNRGRLGRCRRN